MRTMTTNEVTNVVFLINKAEEIEESRNLSIRSLMHLQAQADTYYDLILSDSIVHQSSLIDPLEKACDIFDMLIAEHQHNEYMSKVAALCNNDEYEALPDSIRRTK